MRDAMDKFQKAELFLMRFRGRRDCYGLKFVHADGKHDYYKQDEAVTPEVALRHIEGREQLMFYLQDTPTTINFAGFDFDCKSENAPDGYYWEHVKKVSDVLTEWSVPHHIARSTTFGFHIYHFFAEPFPAHVFRAFAKEVLIKAGLQEEWAKGRLVADGKRVKIKPVEVYPKANFQLGDGYGNGMSPPMIEPRFPYERNCFVDRNNVFIDDQWEYLRTATEVDDEISTAVIENGIIILTSDEVQQKIERAKKNYTDTGSYGDREEPTGGAIEKTLAACEAFRSINTRVKSGEVLGHHDGMPLLHLAINVKDGMEWFDKNVHGWGETESDRKEIKQSIDSGYKAWTCQKMKENGVCHKEGWCLEPQPSKENIEKGEPKELWPMPSPKRYAFGDGEELLEDLKAEIAGTLALPESSERDEKVKALFLRTLVLDKERRKIFEEYVKDLGGLPKKAVKALALEVTKEHFKEEKQKIRKSSTYATFDDMEFVRVRPNGYALLKTDPKTFETSEILLASVDIEITEERREIDSSGATIGMEYVGYVKWGKQTRNFKISAQRYGKNEDFYNAIAEVAGSAFYPHPNHYAHLKQAILAFSRENIVKTEYMNAQGFNKEGVYVMPSVRAGKNLCEENTTTFVDLSEIPVVKNLDFKIVSDERFKELLDHLVKDFLTSWPESWTYPGLAHVFLPAVKKILPVIKWSHVLFYEGLTGSGKSALTKVLQQFYGNFESLQTFEGSPKSIGVLCQKFKDALLVVDDYKGINANQDSVLRTTVQYAYEPNAASKLHKDGTLKRESPYLATLIMSGEKMVDDSSVIARTINVETHKQDFLKTHESYQRVLENMEDYKAITPRFIQWAMSLDQSAYEKLLTDERKELQKSFTSAQNAPRLSQNLATNYVCWAMVCDFFEEFGVISHVENMKMKAKHKTELKSTMAKMVTLCSEGQESTKFTSLLAQAILMGKASVRDLPGYDPSEHPYAVPIGHYRKDKNALCLLPDTTIQAVKAAFTTIKVPLDRQSIGRQWQKDEVLMETDKDALTKSMHVNGHKARYWVIELSQLGLNIQSDEQVEQETPFGYQPSAQVIPFATRENAVERDGKGIF
jgi:hypothetical protein